MNARTQDLSAGSGSGSATTARDDVTVMVAGQGGDGSLTVIAFLSRALSQRGLDLFRTSNIASRIKGGHAAAILRGSAVRRGCLGDKLDILVAFDDEAIEKAGPSVADDGIVIYDVSRGPLPGGILPPTARVIEVPFGRLAVRDLRRDLFKNCFGFGVLSRVMGLTDDEALDCLKHRFRRLSEEDLMPNIGALKNGFAFADDLDMTTDHGLIELPRLEKEDRIMITGNEATAFGFLAAGGRFFAGYPITPATDIMDWLGKRFPQFGGVAMQAEDELAAINMVIGASLAGAKAMTASSGPGIALMQEGIGHCGSAEIPLVIVDCQRAGPSTGMPTKPEQSDIGLMTQGAPGDFPRVVLCPGTPEECFEYGVLATNLAQVAQCPIYIALDGLCQFTYTVPAFDLDSVEIDNGKRLSDAEISKLGEYRRYAITEDGISPWAIPGQPEGMGLMTGNERNEWGQVSTDPANRIAMVDKRARKIDSIRHRLPGAYEWGDEQAEVGVVCVGMVGDVLAEARERLAEQGTILICHRPRTLWPLLDDTVDFVKNCDRVYVVELNKSGQLAQLLKSAGAPAQKMQSILKYDGVPMSVAELVAAILEKERAR
ncbi:MAG: 2-oxoacid:acceptor oxidoreductase subunit alpha [Proteobacteria bacterium]|nr:2-oxoacid:acceptor oxidoreductase subunit alpha [Pseudomonadota bacterium]